MNPTHSLLILFIAAFAATNCKQEEPESTHPFADESAPTIAEISANYESLNRLSPEPVLVHSEVAYLCRPLSGEEYERGEKALGPHRNTMIDVYMNDLAKTAFESGEVPYPVGAVVIKEKFRLAESTPKPQAKKATLPADYWGDFAAGSFEYDGVGGMVKRESGSSPESGDWEYFYFTSPTEIKSGESMRSCAACHEGAKDKDRVFGNWASRIQ